MNPKFSNRQRASAVFLFPFNLVASVVDAVFCIPWLGRILKMIWNSILTLLHFMLGLWEFLAWRLGFRPIKKLKVGVILLSDERNQTVVDADHVVAALQKTAAFFEEEAKVKLLPAAHIPKTQSGDQQPLHAWITILDHQSSRRILEVGCNGKAILDDLGTPGASFQWANLRRQFFTSFRRVSGYGAPITIFIVREIEGKIGCSLGWLTDYVTVQHNQLKAIPHELGHACNLLHRNNSPTNLMHPIVPDVPQLTDWQAAVMRSSRHVTIL